MTLSLFLRTKDLLHWFTSSKSTQEHHGNVLMGLSLFVLSISSTCERVRKTLTTSSVRKNTDLQSSRTSHKIKRSTNQRNKVNTESETDQRRRPPQNTPRCLSCFTCYSDGTLFDTLCRGSEAQRYINNVTLLDRLSLMRPLRVFLSLMDGERRRLLMRLLMVKASMSLRVLHSLTSEVNSSKTPQ